jgi:hypothetical protein
MDKYILEIQNAIEKAAIDGTLTKDAIGQFNSLIEHNEALQSQALDFDKKFYRQDGEIKELTTNLSIAQGLNKVAAEMEAAIINREQKMTELELTAKHEAKRVEDHQNMFGLVFRNAVIRSSVLGQELVAIPGTPDTVDQYGVRQYGSGREPDVTGVPVSKTEDKEET